MNTSQTLRPEERRAASAPSMTGSKALIESFLQEGVETVFGYPGGAIIPVYDALYDYRDRLRHILVRHEQGAVHAAQGYALLEEKRRKKAEGCKEAHMKAQMEENALAARIRLLSDMERQREGFSRAVKLVMDQADRGILKGVHGPVAGLVKAPDRVALAIETALGGAMQNIVVDREEDGKAVGHYNYLDANSGERWCLNAKDSWFGCGKIIGSCYY